MTEPDWSSGARDGYGNAPQILVSSSHTDRDLSAAGKTDTALRVTK